VPSDSVDDEPSRHTAPTRLARFKIPRRIIIVERLPKGITRRLSSIGAQHL
jgi:hypothetical protein